MSHSDLTRIHTQQTKFCCSCRQQKAINKCLKMHKQLASHHTYGFMPFFLVSWQLFMNNPLFSYLQS